jgi:hypothetical protein
MSHLWQRSGESPKFWKFERSQDKGVPESGLDWEDPIPKLSESQPLKKSRSLKEKTQFGGGSLDRGDVSPNVQVQGETEGLILARP